MDGVRGHQLFSLCGPGGATSNLVVNSMILTAKRSAVWQQTVIIIPKVDISGLCEPLCGVWRCRQMRTGAPEFPLWMICGANPAVVPVFRRVFTTRLLRTAQFRVAKSPNHPAEIEEKRAHDHDHERVGLYHGFGDWRCHLFGCAGIIIVAKVCAGGTVSATGVILLPGWITSAPLSSVTWDRDKQKVNECYCCQLSPWTKCTVSALCGVTQKSNCRWNKAFWLHKMNIGPIKYN